MLPSIAQELTQGSEVNVYKFGSETKWKGYISRIDSSLDPISQQTDVYVALENGQHPFSLNEFVPVTLMLPERSNALPVPASLVYNNEVWVVTQDNIVARRALKSLWKNQETIWLENQLIEGDRVLSHMLPEGYEGQKAQVTGIVL